MKGMKCALATVLAVAIMLAPAVSVPYDADASQPAGSVLLDRGNGSVAWFASMGTGTVGEVICTTLNANGHTASVAGTVLTIDGKTSMTIGGASTTADPFTTPGLSGITVTSQWNVYKWNGTAWAAASASDTAENGAYYAAGFYPAGTVPAETPQFHALTCNGTDSECSNSQTAAVSSETESEIAWNYSSSTEGMGGNFAVYSQILLAGGYALVKYGYSTAQPYPNTAMFACINLDSGEVKWSFRYSRSYYEVTTAAVVGDYVYVQSSYSDMTENDGGIIYKINWAASSGELHLSDVTTFCGESAATCTKEIPNDTGADIHGNDFAYGPTTLVYDSGALFTKAYNGMVYCFDLDLNPIWSYQTAGKAYTYQPTVIDGYVIAGMLNGRLYILNEADGSLVKDQLVFTSTYMGDPDVGGISQIVPVRKGTDICLFMTFSDGLGMSSMKGGMAMYRLNTSTNDLTQAMYRMDLGVTSSYLTPVTVDGVQYIYFMSNRGTSTSLCRVDTDANVETLNTDVYETHAAIVLLNGNTLVASAYNKSYPACMYSLSGEKTGECWMPKDYQAYCMSCVVMYDGGFLMGNDSNFVCFKGTFGTPKVIEPTDGMDLSGVYAIIIAVVSVAAVFAAAYCFMRFGLGWEHPFSCLRERFTSFLFGEEYTHNTLRRHRLWIIMAIGIILSLCACAASLCLGPTESLGIGDMFGALFSAIGKGGKNLTYDEMMVYSARLPRTIVALAVGIGLSVAGAMYQAIIRNPLVDPYIMGVSSGAGTAAIGVIAFDFTFFGLFQPHSIFLTAAAAALGGIAAFFCTMLLAHRAGGTSINYVLSGVIVGLVFSAVQTLMMTFAGNHVTSALSWLYGSFSEISWSKVWIVVIPVIGISLASLFWAKEFNLVLLGEDQAKQMGLNVRQFNRWMLIIASLLTSVCVAFVGIIGFVGLVIPHLCRMMLGGDHRLVLPASMAFGGFLMVVADMASRLVIPGFELPVGAITTIIGVPVFAWLLIKRGKMYDG